MAVTRMYAFRGAHDRRTAQIMGCHFLIVVEAPPIVLTFLCRWCLLQIGDGLF